MHSIYAKTDCHKKYLKSELLLSYTFLTSLEEDCDVNQTFYLILKKLETREI